MTLTRLPAQLLVTSQDDTLVREVRALLTAYQVPCAVLGGPQDCEQAPLCRWFKDAPLSDAARVHALLADAIGVIERSRHAFRSRELGQLRRRLVEALEELSRVPPLV
ncbi:hypothetical protein [Pseudomonas citronellolis]|uniref:hypothetical protein n=1 Tax=Pseudomonas citronellolis TaxID=53408 RepID=UPI0023E3AE55|nr:hypothetical protein [Pseudomonas citronellolis]MDF3931855.1 hypothetical protein [Pseudomonas citronellolis]